MDDDGDDEVGDNEWNFKEQIDSVEIEFMFIPFLHVMEWLAPDKLCLDTSRYSFLGWIVNSRLQAIKSTGCHGW